ncbi:MAG: acyltransferase family protein, partial [Bacteroidales bacterium]|nr:acyltransferase family protein [Bacteroidales bacterium]
METLRSAASFADTKPHYDILDGLRGAAALLVVWYHVFEGFAFAGGDAIIKGINHGYLAVDFFFILSGFVISYAYDDRWAGSSSNSDRNPLTLKNFFLRRIIRLHPMVIIGAITGAITFLMQGSVQWDGTR